MDARKVFRSGLCFLAISCCGLFRAAPVHAESPGFEYPVEQPAEAPPEQPVEAPPELPAELPPELPAELPPERPAELPPELPAELPPEVPAELPAELPPERPVEPSPDGGTVAAKDGGPDAGVGLPDNGCGCQIGDTGKGAGALFLLIAGVVLARRTRVSG